jgi:hypothetical protein
MPYVQWGGEFCIILLSYTEVLVLGGLQVDVGEGGVLKSHGVSGEGGGGVCDSAGYLARSRRVAYSYLALCCYGGSVELCSTEFSRLSLE